MFSTFNTAAEQERFHGLHLDEIRSVLSKLLHTPYKVCIYTCTTDCNRSLVFVGGSFARNGSADDGGIGGAEGTGRRWRYLGDP